ncbi:hypothetical protein ABZ815_02890 [Nonomuraea sp. NPDC047529]|uniref:hypothetical protein n=1 Tax=Nonomuraea sp. NPDC047529 TaxID=3155623 RepID=UPI0033F8E161
MIAVMLLPPWSCPSRPRSSGRGVRAWITVKHHYGLTVTHREKRALIRMLRTCFSALPSS